MLTFLAFWFHARWELDFGPIGLVLAGVSVVAGLSGEMALASFRTVASR